MRPGPGSSTLSVHGAPVASPAGLATPVARAAAQRGAAGWQYGRFANPTVDAAARRIAALEAADDALLVESGTAAIGCALLALTRVGSTVVAARELCEDALRLLDGLPGLGRSVTLVPVDDVAGWHAALARPEAAVAYVETVSNPDLCVADVPRLAGIAHAGGAALVVDATLTTPVNQHVLAEGADLVVHSAGKYLNGHGDVIAGAIAGAREPMAVVREQVQRGGGCLDPAAASLLERGLKTLALRMQRHSANAAALTRMLAAAPGVTGARHVPGTGVLAFTLAGGAAAVGELAARLRLIGQAPTLGAAESLIWSPALDGREAPAPLRWHPSLVRLSAGLEDADDLIGDLTAALRSQRAAAVP
jgi:cystathionine beta-lyase/cystathionine gamma-synthase